MNCQSVRWRRVATLLVVAWILNSQSPHAWPQLGRRPAKDYIPLLESPDRINRLKPDQVITQLNLSPGDVVADVGAGSGVFTRRLAQTVGSTGRVYAIDIDQELLDYNRSKVEESHLSNVDFILGGFDDPKLPQNAVDLAFVCDVLHHIEHRQIYLSKLRSCLKPKGRLAIIDYRENWPPGHEQMKYTTDELLAWIKAAGFEKTGQFDSIPDAFFMVFQPSSARP